MAERALDAARYQLTDRQMAAALTLAELDWSDDENLAGLPPVDDPIDALRGTPMLHPAGALTVEAGTALDLLGGGEQVVTVITNVTGADAAEVTHFYSGWDGPPILAWSARQRAEGRIFDLALLPTASEAAAMLDDRLMITALPASPGGHPVELTGPAYAALLGACDVMKHRRMEAELNRQTTPPPCDLMLEEVSEFLMAGLDTADTRWASTAGALVCPYDLGTASDEIERGLRGLIDAQLIRSTDGQYELTESGAGLTRAMAQSIMTASLSLAVIGPDAGDGEAPAVSVGAISLFRTPTAILLGAWETVDGDDAAMTLVQVEAGLAMRTLQNLIHPKLAKR